MTKILDKISVSLLLFFVGTYMSFGQFEIPEIPKKQTSVYDYANILNPDEAKVLENKLVKYSDSTSTQIVFISIEDLKGEDIGILAPKWGHKWGIGQKKEDNGVIILLSKNQRKIWISPGYGVEDRLTAGITGSIIRGTILPYFKQGNYFQGLSAGSDAIFDALNGKYKATRKKNEGSVLPFLLIVGFIVLFIIISSKNKGNGGNNGRNFRGPDIFDMIILSNLGRSSGGGGFGSSDSGGFGGGFGGGGFSGGGAGGDW
jgi:uncharacterized protein